MIKLQAKRLYELLLIINGGLIWLNCIEKFVAAITLSAKLSPLD